MSRGIRGLMLHVCFCILLIFCANQMVIYNNNVWEESDRGKGEGVLFILIKMQTQGMIID